MITLPVIALTKTPGEVVVVVAAAAVAVDVIIHVISSATTAVVWVTWLVTVQLKAR